MDEIEFYNWLNFDKSLTESDIEKIDVRSQIQQQIQNQQTKDSGCRFDKLNSMTICFLKTTELNWSGFVKFPLGSLAILFNKK